MEKVYNPPVPVINYIESNSFKNLTEEYEKLTKPGIIAKSGKAISRVIPKGVKNAVGKSKDSMSELELYKQAMEVIVVGFNKVEELAAKYTISEKEIIENAQKYSKSNKLSNVNELCLLRSYDIAKFVDSFKNRDLLLALTEGATTGFFGFAGIPFNLVLSTFLYYRAVQSIAMSYGYDIKNNSSEMVIAGEVFMSALSPTDNNHSTMGGMIGKVMMITQTTALRQAANKTWKEMAEHGGIQLILCQIRALANKSAQKALQKAGQKGLEKTVFNEIFEQLGKRLTKETIKKSMPVFGAVIGGLFDTAQMHSILEYADIFYQKRFILEKEVRINSLINKSDEYAIIEVE